jgi:two-component system LytT family sensor kinase
LRIIFQRRYLFHLLFWLMYSLFMILEMQGYIKQKSWLFSLRPLFLHLGLMALLVYGHTLILIPLLLEKKKTVLYISGIILLMVGYTLVRSKSQQYWDGVVWPQDLMTLQSYFEWNFFYALWFILISSMLFFTQKWSEQKQEVKNIQISQLQTELKYLRAQVNPHFLFNGLNTIYGYIDIENQQARDMLVQFSDLLRYNLYEADVDMIELEQETIYLQNYVALQKARSNDNMRIGLEISIEDPGVKIVPLIFMAFVENAFKYSTREDNRDNSIKISLRQSGKLILFECANSYEENLAVAGGIGLNNAMRRLELLYKDRYTLTIKKEEKIYYVALTLVI